MAAPLIYFMTVSLDGFINRPDGSFDWSAPDAEVHGFVNELLRPARRHLYGRRNYEVMAVWEDLDPDSLPAAERDFALEWPGIEKVVYSSTLTEVSTTNTLLRRDFDAEEVARWKAESPTPLAIGGAGLASAAARAGLLDEIHLILVPVLLGGGTRWAPEGVGLRLELIEERRFGNGFVYAGYRVR